MSKPKLTDLIAAAAKRQAANPPVGAAAGGMATGQPSDMRPEGPPAQTQPKQATTAAAPASLPSVPPDKKGQTQAMAHALRARRFVQAYIASGFNGTKAYRAIMPGAKGRSAEANAYRLLQDQRIQEELHRQLRSIEVMAEVDTEYLFRAMQSMEAADIFDYFPQWKNGKPDLKDFDPSKLTLEQRRNVRELRFDRETGKLVSFKLVSREKAIDMLNRAKNIYGDRPDEAGNLADTLRRRMIEAAKRVPHITIDATTGKIIS